MNKHEFLAIGFQKGLKVILNQKGIFNLDEEYPQPHSEICEIINIVKSHDEYEYEISDGFISYGFIGIDEFDLLARPLSNLTKPITHKGETFVPIDKLKELFEDGTEDLLNSSIEAIEYFVENNLFLRMKYLPFILIKRLIKWHFDIAELIEKGEAIDVNTLDENPYE